MLWRHHRDHRSLHPQKSWRKNLQIMSKADVYECFKNVTFGNPSAPYSKSGYDPTMPMQTSRCPSQKVQLRITFGSWTHVYICSEPLHQELLPRLTILKELSCLLH